MSEDGKAPASRHYSVNAIHLVRTAAQTNLTLSQMADHKASLLMGANFLVFTIVVGQMARSTHVPLALLVLAGFAFLSAFCAAVAVLPSTRASATRPHAEPNYLFFGTFTALSEEAFVETMLDRMQHDDQIMRTMLRDLYQNGQVLQHKKYRLLGWAYRLLLVGLVVTALTFMAEFAFGLI